MSRVRAPSFAHFHLRVSIVTLIEALILGLLQGVTEFIPVSSSAHLKLAKLFLGLESGAGGVLFDLACHVGTLIALLWVLRHEIQALYQKRRDLLLLSAALVPLIPFYFLLKPLREMASHPYCLGPCLMITAALLFCAHTLRLRARPPGLSSSLWIGSLQALALIPGISRSASTIPTPPLLPFNPL